MMRILLLIFTVLMLLGCATKIDTLVTVPANVGDVVQYPNVAVFTFDGKGGREVSAKIESILFEAEVGGQKVFKASDRNQIDKVLAEQKLQMTIADPDTAVRLGKLLGVQAIWTGVVSERTDTVNFYETRQKCGSYDSKGKCLRYYDSRIGCTKIDVTVNVTPKLVSVSTAGVIYSRVLASSQSAKYCSDSYIKTTPQELIGIAMNDIFVEFRKDVAPYSKRVQLEIMSDDNDIADKPSKELLKNGIEFAKNNRLPKSCEMWADAKQKNPKSISLNYNLGLCLEVVGKYEDALEIFNEIESNLMKPNKLVADAILRSQQNIENQKKLKSQMGK